MSEHLNSIIANLSGPEGVRHTVHEGKDTLVVPVVMIVEGVLNGALLTQYEFGKYPESWNGIPVPVLHPEDRGEPISANKPDVIERIVGRIFNTWVDNGKLKAEVWIDVEKAKRMGHGQMMEALESGQTVEVSTGYFSEDRAMVGEYNGKEYMSQHINIRPDHLALLPGQIGACSVADGCGTRVNSDKGFLMKTKDAFNVLASALGLRANCECQEEEGEPMTDKLKKQAEKLKANEKITPKQFEMIMSLDPEQKAMVQALLASLENAPAETEEPEEPEEMKGDGYEEMEDGADEDGAPMNVNKADIDKLVANKVAEHLRRADVTGKLTANEQCPFSEDDLKVMSIAHLEKLEKSYRKADYSGQGGFGVHASQQGDVVPLQPRGFIHNKRSKEA